MKTLTFFHFCRKFLWSPFLPEVGKSKGLSKAVFPAVSIQSCRANKTHFISWSPKEGMWSSLCNPSSASCLISARPQSPRFPPSYLSTKGVASRWNLCPGDEDQTQLLLHAIHFGALLSTLLCADKKAESSGCTGVAATSIPHKYAHLLRGWKWNISILANSHSCEICLKRFWFGLGRRNMCLGFWARSSAVRHLCLNGV